MSAIQWCSRVGELFATAWSGPAARLSRRPRPCRASLCPCEWTVDSEAGRCGTETPALYVTRAHKKLPIKQGQMWTSPSLARSTQEWQMYPLGSWKLLTVKSNESSDHINTHCQSQPIGRGSFRQYTLNLWIIRSPCVVNVSTDSEKDMSLFKYCCVCPFLVNVYAMRSKYDFITHAPRLPKFVLLHDGMGWFLDQHHTMHYWLMMKCWRCLENVIIDQPLRRRRDKLNCLLICHNLELPPPKLVKTSS